MERTTDKLGRRFRFTTKPQPKGKFFDVESPTLHNVIEALDRHGTLTSWALFQFSGLRNHKTFQKQLTVWANGTERIPPFVFRPPGQVQALNKESAYLVYQMTKKGREALKNPSPYARHDNHFVHQLFNGHIAASIELLCREKEWEYITRRAILDRKGSTLDLPLLSGKLVPDDLFGIKRGDEYRFFAVEVDRATEAYSRSESTAPTIEGKVKKYVEVLKGKLQSYWGIPLFSVLVCTTTTNRALKMQALVQKMAPEYAKRFHFLVYPDFGDYWRVPRRMYADVLDFIN